MDCNIQLKNQLNPFIASITPYTPGKPVSELQRELGLTQISKLASNENPLGASPKVTEAIQQALTDIARYPDGSAYYLKSELANFLNLSLDQIAVGNGSNELLELVARIFAVPGDEIIFSEHAFAVYPISAQVVGATPVSVPAKNWGHDLEAMLQAITNQTKVVYLANPNNPTGTLFLKQEWEAFIEKVPANVIVVLDEAYLEYVDHSDYANGIDYLKRYPNLLVSRTFSKAYGLASLRVGYMAGSAELMGYVNQVRAPFNVNQFAQVGAVAALQDQSFVEQGVALNRQEMAKMIAAFNQLGLDYIPSYGNFVCVEFPDNKASATEINTALLHKGVIVRPVGNYKMPNHLRISIGSETENSHFLSALQDLKGLYE